MLIVKRVQRLRGGGGDGGVYPLTHAEQKWMTPSGMGTTGGGCHSNMTKDRARQSSVCAATDRAPIAVDKLGYLLNKEDVIELMLSKALPPHLSHIKSLKSLRDATMHPNPAYVAAQKAGSLGRSSGKSEDDDEPPFFCPVAMLPLNGRYPFVLIKATGHVVSQRALKQVGGKLCPVTETPLESADATLAINPSRRSATSSLRSCRPSGQRAKRARARRRRRHLLRLRRPAAAGDPALRGSTSGVASTVSMAAEAGASSGKAKSGKAKAPPGGGPMPPPVAKRPKVGESAAASVGTAAHAQKAASNDVYKSLFISAEDRKKQEKADAANCARSIVPSVNHSGFGLG